VQQLLNCNLGTRNFGASPNDTAFSFPPLVEGEMLVLSFRFWLNANGATTEVQRTVHSFQALLGPLDARPTKGYVKLKVGAATAVDGVNVTDALNVATLTASIVETAINELSGLTGFTPVTVWENNGTFNVQGANGVEKEFSLHGNSTVPISFLKVTVGTVDGNTVHGLRLVQTPGAFTDQQSRVVLPPPLVTTRIDGSSEDGNKRNEIQEITFHPALRCLYQIGYSGKTTTVLKLGTGTTDDPIDSINVIQAALNKIADAGGKFIVTAPDTRTLRVEFTGTMGEGDQDPLTVSIYSVPAGDVTCFLSLKTAELAALLDASKDKQITIPLEIFATLENEEDGEILEDHPIVRTDVTVVRRLGGAELMSAPSIDWALPPLPKSYIPFNTSQTGIGSFSYPQVIGDDDNTVFTIAHNQDSDEISNVNVLGNTTPGAALIPGTDFTWARINSNVVEVTIIGFTPGVDALRVIITFAQVRSQFVEGVTFEMGQVNGLDVALAAFDDRVSAVEDRMGISSLGTVATSTAVAGVKWTFPPFWSVLGVRLAVNKVTEAAAQPFATVDRSKWKKQGGGLFRAIHDAAATTLSSSLPEPDDGAVTAGILYQNDSGDDFELTAALSHKSGIVKDGEYLATNGEAWYKVTQDIPGKNSWYPADFSKELFQISVTDAELIPASYLEVQFGLELAVFDSSSPLQLIVEIRRGVFTSAASPDPTGENIDGITWTTTPMLRVPVRLTSNVPVTRAFGCRVSRSAVGTLAATQLINGAETAAGTVPTTPNFLIQARIIGVDILDSVAKPRGFFALRGLNADPSANGISAAKLGIAQIIGIQ
jgi:hypothetical protein